MSCLRASHSWQCCSRCSAVIMSVCVVPVSVYCDWVREVWSATSTSVWQHITCLRRSIPEVHFSCSRDVSRHQDGCWLLNVPATCKCISGTDTTKKQTQCGPGAKGHRIYRKPQAYYWLNSFWAVLLLVGCLTSQQHVSVSQGRICSDMFTYCHTEMEVADSTVHLTHSQDTDTRPTSPSTDPVTPGAWQGSHWSANF